MNKNTNHGRSDTYKEKSSGRRNYITRENIEK